MDFIGIRIALLIWGFCTLIIRSVYVRRARQRKAREDTSYINPHPLVLGAMSLWVILLVIFVVWPHVLLDEQFLIYASPPMALEIMGVVGLILGLWLFIRAHQALGEFYGVTLFVKEAHQVIEAGPYAYVRHPMYTTYLFWLLSTLLFLPHYTVLCLLLMALIGFYQMAKGEEEMLCHALGEPYEAYVEKTGMFLPKW